MASPPRTRGGRGRAGKEGASQLEVYTVCAFLASDFDSSFSFSVSAQRRGDSVETAQQGVRACVQEEPIFFFLPTGCSAVNETARPTCSSGSKRFARLPCASLASRGGNPCEGPNKTRTEEKSTRRFFMQRSVAPSLFLAENQFQNFKVSI